MVQVPGPRTAGSNEPSLLTGCAQLTQLYVTPVDGMLFVGATVPPFVHTVVG